MAKVISEENFRVVVEPYNPVWWNMTPKQIKQECESIVEQIKRHVDSLGHVWIDSDTISKCEHCGADWTESDSQYNRGCCQADEQAEEDRIARQS